MNMILRNLTGFLAPVFLFQILPIQAETNAQNTTEETSSPTSTMTSLFPTPTSTPPLPDVETIACNDINMDEQTTGVKQRLTESSELISGRQCLILKADPSEDLSSLIERIPDNTVILLSSETVFPPTSSPSTHSSTSAVIETTSVLLMPSPTASPDPVQPTADYYIGSEVVLRNGQDLLGAADEGFEIVIKDLADFSDGHMIKIGETKNFQMEDRADSTIQYITFSPKRNNNRKSVDSIIFAECYNRTLNVEHNHFQLDTRAAVFLDCKEPLDATADSMKTGPGLRFTNNTVVGETHRVNSDRVIPDEGLFINLPAITHLTDKLEVIENQFEGEMAEAGEFRLGAGSEMNVFRNRVNISNEGQVRSDAVSAEKGAFLLRGINNNDGDSPTFNLAGNNLTVTKTSISIDGHLTLAFACNTLQANDPWQQIKASLSLLATGHMELSDECSDPVSSSGVALTSLSPLSTNNLWTAREGSQATACSGLQNMEGQLFFESETCSSVMPTSPPSSTAGTTASPTPVIGTYSGQTPSPTLTPSPTIESAAEILSSALGLMIGLVMLALMI